MHSITKTRLGSDTAAQIVAATFGAGARLGQLSELTEGFFNAAYLAELEDGRRCVLKIAPPDAVPILRYERDIIHAELAALELVRQRTSLPVPRVYRFDQSRQLVPSPYIVMEFVPGVPLHRLRDSLTDGERQAIDRALGGYLRQVNAIGGAAFGYLAPGAARSASWRECFLAMVEWVLDDGAANGVPLPLPYPELRARIRRAAAPLDAVVAPQLLHWDLWDGNVFVDPETRQISGIIDWERALWGDPLMEYQFRTLEVSPGFAEGYGVPTPQTPEQRVRRILYNLYLYLIMVIECSYRHYDTPDQERWSREQLDAELGRLEAAL